MCRINGKKQNSAATSVRYNAWTALLGHERKACKGLEASCSLKCSIIRIGGEN